MGEPQSDVSKPFTSGIKSMETTHKPLLVLRSKVVVVGDAHVGKSALVQMFHSGGTTYPRNYVMTSWVDFCVKLVKIPNTNARVEMYIMDCAGQSIFNQVEQNKEHYENASFVIVVYDIASRESFESVATKLHGVRGSRPTSSSRPVPGVLIANKVDLRENDASRGVISRGVVSTKEGQALAEANGLEFFETSAALGKEVDTPFHFIADQVYRKYEATVASAELLASTTIPTEVGHP